MKESKIQKEILNKLKFNPNVIWSCRILAGRIGGFHIAEAGTPDIFAAVDRFDGKIALLFLEVKQPGVTHLRYEQKKFFEKMESKPMVLCRIIHGVDELKIILKEVNSL